MLRALLVPLDEDGGGTTPRRLVGAGPGPHLAWFDEAAVRSALQPEVFAAEQANPDPDGCARRTATVPAPTCWPGSTTPISRLLTAFAGSTPPCACHGTGRR